MSVRWLARELAKNDKSLVGFWPLQDNCDDYSGQSNHVIYGDTVSLKSINRRKGLGLNYSTVKCQNNSPNAYNFDFTSQFTVSFWIFCDNIANVSSTLISNISKNLGWAVVLQAGYVGLQLYSDANSSLPTYTFMAPIQAVNRWRHVVITYENYTVQIYVDGILTVVQKSPSSAGIIALDYFQDADNTLFNNHHMDIGNGWSQYGTGGSNWEIYQPYVNGVTYALQGYIGGGDSFAYTNVLINNMVVKGNIILTNNHQDAPFGIMGRFNSVSLGDCYVLYTKGTAGGNADVETVLSAYVGGREVQLYTFPIVPYTAGINSVISLELILNGNSITAYVTFPGQPQMSYTTTDSSVNGGSYAGLFAGQGAYGTTFLFSSFEVDNFSLNSFASSGQLNLSGSALSIVRVYKRKLTNIDIARLHAKEWDIYRPRPTYSLSHATGVIPLYISGKGTVGTIPLYVDGMATLTGHIPLYVDGGYPTNELTLYIHGLTTFTGNMPLFINGTWPFNHIPLYVEGGPPDNLMPLFIHGSYVNTAGMNLFVKNSPYTAIPEFVPLIITGRSATSTGGLYKEIPLFIAGIPLTNYLNLFIKAPSSSTVVNNMNMFIKGIGHLFDRAMPLFLNNNISGVANMLPLTLAGSTIMPPPTGQPLSGSLNLFIKRYPSNAIPLFIASASPLDNNIPVYIKGTQLESGLITLTIPKTIGTETNNVDLYTSGW